MGPADIFRLYFERADSVCCGMSESVCHAGMSEPVADSQGRDEAVKTLGVETGIPVTCPETELRLQIQYKLEREPESIFQTHLYLDGKSAGPVEAQCKTGSCIETPFSPACPCGLGYHEIVGG